MAWVAKTQAFPFWGKESEQCLGNADEIYNMLFGETGQNWTLPALCGMLGNMWHESGINPWCWQSNHVNVHNGYGLVQFTPAQCYYDGSTPRYGYISGSGLTGYGAGYAGYAPNMSTTEVTGNVSDGHAQVLAINDNAGGKYSSYGRSCPYQDLSSVDTYDKYKQCGDLWIATVGWLFFYEAPKDKSITVANARYQTALIYWKHFTELPPIPPIPPYEDFKKLPLWMYLRNSNLF